MVFPDRSSKPLPDRRKNTELSEDEVQHHIAKREDERRRARNQTKGGLLLGTLGVVVTAANSGLPSMGENIGLALLGFVMTLVGFGFSSPKEAADMIRTILGRNSK